MANLYAPQLPTPGSLISNSATALRVQLNFSNDLANTHIDKKKLFSFGLADKKGNGQTAVHKNKRK